MENDLITTLLPNKELNKEFWKDEKLLSSIRYHLLKVAKTFKDSWDLKTLGIQNVKIVDVVFTGSLANYNWNKKFSDIDLHLELDYSKVRKEDKPLLEAYLLAQKNIFNSEHEIKILNFPVEVYPEDYNSDHFSSGIYSLIKDEWIIKPNKKKIEVDKVYIKHKAENIVKLIDWIEKKSKTEPTEKIVKELDYVKAAIKKLRQQALEAKGEYAEDNLVFKVLRRLGTLDKLYDLKIGIVDKDLTL